MNSFQQAKQSLESYKRIQVQKERDIRKGKQSVFYDSYYMPIEQFEIYRKCTEEYLPEALETIRELTKELKELKKFLDNETSGVIQQNV